MRHGLPALILLAILSAWPASAAKPPPLGDETPAPPPRLNGMRAVASGSGFVVAPGRVLTNAHVVRGCRALIARNAQGRSARAGVLRADPRVDLALVNVPQGFGPALAFRDGPPVQRGESVVTYGFPLTGLLSSGPTLTTGSVSALSGLRDTPLHYTISAPVQPGNSGGPLLDAQGHVVGVVVAKLDAAAVARALGGDIPQNVNFAIKGDAALAFLRDGGVEPALADSGGAELGAAQVGEVANPATAFLQCLR